MPTTTSPLTNDGIPPVIARADVPRAAPGQKVPYIELDEAVRLVTGRIPSLEASAVFLPGNAYSPMFVAGRGWYPLMFQSAALNPYTGKIETTRLLSDRTPLQFVTESMRPLHTGDFGGIWVKLIWFVFGLLLSMMVLSGLLIWSKRTAQATAALVKRGKRPARQPKPAKPAPVMANQTAEGQP
ncbi:peptidase [Pseudomonas aeruginosa]|nr:peptidase [Pseudomonas aeruginosa]